MPINIDELKAKVLSLLDDPDVRAKLREAVMDGGHLIDARTRDGEGRVALLTQIDVPPGTSPEAVQRAVAAVVEPATRARAPVVLPWLARKGIGGKGTPQ